MDKLEAKRVLQAFRPNRVDAAQPLFAEALAVVESDHELKAWWQAQQAFDRKVAAKLEEIPIPADLRATILAGQKIKPFPTPSRLPQWLAIAAVIAVLCVVGTFLRTPTASTPLARTDYNAAVIPLLNHDAPSLAMMSPDQNKLVAWLKEQNAPTGGLPAKMTTLPTVGCQKFIVHGHAVTLICFALAGGGIAHLFIVSQDALNDPPTVNVPEFKQVEGWSTAAWSDGRMSYMLATQAGPDALKQLL